MVLDGLRGYLQLANGLTEVTRARAAATAKALVAQGEASVGSVVPTPVKAQVSALTEDLMATSKANRDLMLNLVRSEVERQVARLGLVSAQELDAAARRAKGLERRVAELEQDLRASSAARKGAVTRARTATKTSAKRSAAKRSAAKTSTAAKKSTAKKSAAKKSTAKKMAAKKSATRKTTATRSARTTKATSGSSTT